MLRKIITMLFLFAYISLSFGQTQTKSEKAELSNPFQYLKMYNYDRKVNALLGTEYTFYLQNNAKQITYEEILVKIEFVNKNGVVYAEQIHSLGEIPPNVYTKKGIVLKISEPNVFKWSTFRCKLISAKGYNQEAGEYWGDQ